MKQSIQKCVTQSVCISHHTLLDVRFHLFRMLFNLKFHLC